MGILGVITFFQGDQLATGPLLEQALAAARAQADIWLEVFMLRLDGLVRLFGAEPVEAERLLLHARKLAQRAALRTMEASILGDLASVAVARGDLDAAEAHLRSSLRITHGGVDPWSEAMTINSLGDLLRARGDFAGAAAAYAEALPTLRAMNNDVAPPGMLHNFGYVALGRDDPRDALRTFLQSADGYRSIGGDRRALAECVIGMGAAAVRLGQAELAARLFGAAQATLEELGTSITPSNQADYERGRSELAGRLSPAQLAAYLAEGRRLSVEQALDLGRSLSASTAVEVPMAGLTQRELEIARLLAQGYRNRQIAESLVITEKTVANHVQRVLDKLGVRSRAQVAARAADLGLA
jgi:non-specific serine/threonine protein kinase